MSRKENTDDIAALTSFLSNKDKILQEALLELHTRDQPLPKDDPTQARRIGNLSEEMIQGLLWLQFFDWLSLSLCCTPKEPEWGQTTPARQQLAFTRSSTNGVEEIAVTPYPFDTDPLQLSVPAREIPAGWYQSADDYLSAYENGRTVELHWQLNA